LNDEIENKLNFYKGLREKLEMRTVRTKLEKIVSYIWIV
jgi:hypothetical protein